MASLLIRNFDAALHARLKARARDHHRSLEEEARETLRAAVAREVAAPVDDNIAVIARRLFGAEGGFDLPPRDHDTLRPVPDFSGPEYDR